MTGTIEKRCVVCGKDVANEKRTKDTSGRYYCSGCYQAAATAQRAPQPTASMAAPQTSTPHTVSNGSQRPVAKLPPAAVANSNTPKSKLKLFTMIAGVIVVLGGIAVFKVISDRNAAQAQARQMAEAARISEQAKADLAQAEKLRAEQAQRDLEAKEAEAAAKKQAEQNDPAKLFEAFSTAFMQEVAGQITSTSYVCKVDDKYTISATRTNNLMAPIQGVIEGGVLTRYQGQANAASTPVRLTFALQDRTWVLAAIEDKDVVVSSGPYGREIHVGPWELCPNMNGFEGFFVKATDHANNAAKK